MINTSSIPVPPGDSPRRYRPVFIMLLAATIVLSLGCASWEKPPPFDDSVLRERAVSAEFEGVRLSAAVLSSTDSQRMFGAKVNETDVQPVWIEVENQTKQALWLLRSGTDPDLFSPLEVAWSFHKTFAGETNARIDEHFHALAFDNPIPAGQSKNGIIFANPHSKTRLLSIDILGQGHLFPFTLFPEVPDDAGDAEQTISMVRQLIAAAEDNFEDMEALRSALEQAPCCATDSAGNAQGDPLNVVVIGSMDDIATAFVRRGFRSDRQPVDDVQILFGRPPDVVARKSSQGGLPDNWVRMWVAPFRYRDQAVMLAQAGRPSGWRLWQPEEGEARKPVLNPNVDQVRNILLQDMFYSSGLDKLAFVDGVGATPAGAYRDSLGGGRYQTDGLRTVLFLTTRPRSLSDVELLDWHPALKLREAEVIQAIENAGD